MVMGRLVAFALTAMLLAPSGAVAQIDFDKIWGDIKKAGERAETEDGSDTTKPAPRPAPSREPATTTSTTSEPRTTSRETIDGEPARYDRPWVREMQGYLKDLGHLGGSVDGLYGRGTRGAIRAFERAEGMEVTGLPTPRVMRALRDIDAGASETASRETAPAPRETAPERESAAGTETTDRGAVSDNGETASWRGSREVEEERDVARATTTSAPAPRATSREAPRATTSRPTTTAAAPTGQAALDAEARLRLNRLGYDAGPDEGGAPAQTAEAVRAFQSDEDLPVDGRVTQALVRLLREAEGDDPNVAPAGLAPAPAPAATAPAPRTETAAKPAPVTETRPATRETVGRETGAPARRGRLGPPTFDALYRLKLANGGHVAADAEASALLHHAYFVRQLNDRRAATGDACRAIRARYESQRRRAALLRDARRDYAADLADAADWPDSTRFRLKFDIGLERFDFDKGYFPLAAPLTRRYVVVRDGNGCGRFRIGIPGEPDRSYITITGGGAVTTLPMTGDEAKALVRGLRNAGKPRKVRIEAIIETRPKRARAAGFDFQASIVQAQAFNPADGRLLHDYDLTAPAAATVAAAKPVPTDAGPAAPEAVDAGEVLDFTGSNLALAALGRAPGLLRKRMVAELARRRVAAEAAQWDGIDDILADRGKRRQLNRKRQHFIYEWSRTAEVNPGLANGPLMDAFVDAGDDWGFVRRHPNWRRGQSALVTATVLSRAQSQRRDASSPISDVDPLVREHLEAAAKRAAETPYLVLEVGLPSIGYDRERRQLRFARPAYETPGVVASDARFVKQLDLLKPIRGAVYGNKRKRGSRDRFLLPASAKGRNAYHLSPPGDDREALRTGFPNNDILGDMLAPVVEWRRDVAELLPTPRALILDAPLRMEGIAMGRRAARRLLEDGPQRAPARGEGWYRARLTVEVTGAAPARRPDEKRLAAAFTGRVVRVDFAAPDGQIFASLGADGKAPRAAAPASPARADNPEQVLAEIRRRREQCSALRDGDEKLACAERLCGYVEAQRGMADTARECRAKVRDARAATASRRTADSAAQRNCRVRFDDADTRSWLPRAGSRAGRRALAACADRPARRAYGPDIVSLRLGMAPEAVRRIMVDRSGSNETATLADPRPFDAAELAVDSRGTRGIAAYWLATASGMRLAGVSRRLYFGRDRPDAGDIEAGLLNKYGKADWRDGRGAYVWHPRSQGVDSELCGELAAIVQPREGWSVSWPAGRRGEARAPLIVGPGGSAREYRRWADCGPVVVAHLRVDRRGGVIDAAFTLFDPAWLAEQPDFLFARGGVTKRKIDF